MAIKSKGKKPGMKEKIIRAGGQLVQSASSGKGKGKKGEGKRRSRGPNYWANKVIVEKLKKKYRALKYGSVR